MSERETEFKFLLPPSAFRKLQGRLGAALRSRSFVNRYFVPTAPATRQDWVLRLRVEGDERELTLKVGSRTPHGTFESVEYTEQVEVDNWRDWVDTEPIRVLRREISEEPLRLQGESRTQRFVYSAPIAVGRHWELDRTELPDGAEFYELEVEIAPPETEELQVKRQALEDFLRSVGIEPQGSDKTKYARFLEAVGGCPE